MKIWIFAKVLVKQGWITPFSTMIRPPKLGFLGPI